MSDPDELALVVKALKSGLGGCVEWHAREKARVRRDMEHCDLTPDGIRSTLIQFVRGGGKVRQVKETRENRKHRDYYYKVILPIPDLFKKGLFVEIELVDDDPDYPEVLLVNAREQK